MRQHDDSGTDSRFVVPNQEQCARLAQFEAQAVR
jgi:hypothetical protein